MSSLGEVFVTKAYARKPAKQGGGRVKVVKADYGDSGTNRAYSMTGRKAGKRVVAAKREKDMADKKPKKSPDAKLSLKPVKKASAGSNKAVAKAGEAQRREMARTRLQRQERQAAAAARKKTTMQRKNAVQDRMGKVTTQRFKQSS